MLTPVLAAVLLQLSHQCCCRLGGFQALNVLQAWADHHRG